MIIIREERKRKLFFREQCQVSNVKGKIELKIIIILQPLNAVTNSLTQIIKILKALSGVSVGN